MTSKKIKQAKIKRALKQEYKGFLPIIKKISRDVYSINKAKKML